MFLNDSSVAAHPGSRSRCELTFRFGAGHSPPNEAHASVTDCPNARLWNWYGWELCWVGLDGPAVAGIICACCASIHGGEPE
jgi:hypothetical protein